MALAIASNTIVAKFTKKAPAKKAPAKKAAAKGLPRRQAPGQRGSQPHPVERMGGQPGTPAYLDGTLPGDAGFDPFGLSAPTEYLQFELDSLNGSAAVNKSGNVIGKLKKVDNKPTERTIVVRILAG